MNELLKIMVSLSLSASVIALLLLALRPLYRNRLHKAWQYYIWLVVVVRLLVPLAPEANLMNRMFTRAETQISNDVAGAGTQLPRQPAVEQPVLPVIVDDLDDLAVPSAQQPVDAPAGKAAMSIWSELQKSLGIVWLGVALLLLVRKITSYNSFMRFIAAGRLEVSDSLALECYRRACESQNVRKPLPLYTNKLAVSPMLTGIWRPCIVLPTVEMNERDLQLVLEHELVHYKRRDILYKWLTQIALCIHWFNPLIYLVSREISKNCELSCDEAVLRSMGEAHKKEYGDTLLASIQTGGSYGDTVVSVTMSEDGKQLRERLESILHFQGKPKTTLAVSLVLAVLLFCGAAYAGAYTGVRSMRKEPDKSVAAYASNAIFAWSNGDGLTQVSVDGGSTWMSAQEYDKVFPATKVEWYTYDEFESWIEQERDRLRGLMRDGVRSWSPELGWFYWNDDLINHVMAVHEDTLEKIGQGMLVSKTVESYVKYNQPGRYTLEYTGGQYGINMALENGETVSLGSFPTQEELFTAMAEYCAGQVEQGGMTENEADEILNQLYADYRKGIAVGDTTPGSSRTVSRRDWRNYVNWDTVDSWKNTVDWDTVSDWKSYVNWDTVENWQDVVDWDDAGGWKDYVNWDAVDDGLRELVPSVKDLVSDIADIVEYEVERYNNITTSKDEEGHSNSWNYYTYAYGKKSGYVVVLGWRKEDSLEDYSYHKAIMVNGAEYTLAFYDQAKSYADNAEIITLVTDTLSEHLKSNGRSSWSDGFFVVRLVQGGNGETPDDFLNKFYNEDDIFGIMEMVELASTACKEELLYKAYDDDDLSAFVFLIGAMPKEFDGTPLAEKMAANGDLSFFVMMGDHMDQQLHNRLFNEMIGIDK